VDVKRFNDMTRTLPALPSRRDVLRGLAAVAGGLGLARLQKNVEARKKRKHKKKDKKPKPNAFGCLDVGQPCRGNSDLCCSSVCGGKKPKRGKKDKRRCIAHNVGGCTPERSFCFADPIQHSLCNPADDNAACLPTTGNAGFCGDFVGFREDENCQLCAKDIDCEEMGFPPGSACVVFDPEGPHCDDICAETENRACMRPGL
jgi:hypothetical protein